MCYKYNIDVNIMSIKNMWQSYMSFSGMCEFTEEKVCHEELNEDIRNVRWKKGEKTIQYACCRHPTATFCYSSTIV